MILIPLAFLALFTAVSFHEPAPVEKSSEQVYREAKEGKR